MKRDLLRSRSRSVVMVRTLVVSTVLGAGLLVATVGAGASPAHRTARAQDPAPVAPVQDPAPPAPAPEPPPPPPPPPPDPFAKVLNHLVISLGAQHVYAIANDGTTLRDMPASTGRNNGTPRGTFFVFRKSEWTTAIGNSAVSMRWMTNFRGGIGFHGIPRQNGRPLPTPLGQAAVSHGCIRLADADAFWIYVMAPMGTRVVVK